MSGITGMAMGMRSNDIAYAPLPLYHSSSLFVFVSGVLCIGATYAFAEKFSVSRFWSDCIKHNATVTQYIGKSNNGSHGLFIVSEKPGFMLQAFD